MLSNLSSFVSKSMLKNELASRYPDACEYSDLDKASNELARRLHEEAVMNCEAIEGDWGNRNHRGFMYNEARAMLEEADTDRLAEIEAQYRVIYKPKKRLES